MTDDELRKALDGLFAYDSGSTDSGIHDEDLRHRCIHELKNKNAQFFSRLIRDMWLSEEALAQGYGLEDALEFTRWLIEQMECRPA